MAFGSALTLPSFVLFFFFTFFQAYVLHLGVSVKLWLRLWLGLRLGLSFTFSSFLPSLLHSCHALLLLHRWRQARSQVSIFGGAQ